MQLQHIGFSVVDNHLQLLILNDLRSLNKPADSDVRFLTKPATIRVKNGKMGSFGGVLRGQPL